MLDQAVFRLRSFSAVPTRRRDGYAGADGRLEIGDHLVTEHVRGNVDLEIRQRKLAQSQQLFAARLL